MQSGSDLFSPNGGIAEVKAINDPITYSTSNYQVAAEGARASRADVFKDGSGEWIYNPRAGELKLAAITFIIPSDRWVDNDFIGHMSNIGVTVFVSHPYINLQSGKFVFSTPQKLNFISDVQPYSVKGDINGVSPNVGKAAQRWRIDEKNKIDGGDN